MMERTAFPPTALEEWIYQTIAPGSGIPFTDALQSYQLQRINETLARARETSPFYRQHLNSCPQVINRLDEMQQIPFTTAGHLRSNPMRFLSVSQNEIARITTLNSSGTTGSPKRLFFTSADIERTVGFFSVGMSMFTRAGDKVLILLPGERQSSAGSLLAQALKRIGVGAVVQGPVIDPEKTLSVMAAEKPSCIVGIPIQVLWLARYPQRIKGSEPGCVMLTSDHVSRSLVRAIEDRLGSVVYTHYGMTETGFGAGVDCHARQGYHLREADLYFEIIDPVGTDPVADGNSGEIVFTTLLRNGMPLIRYRTGDRSQFLRCSCACGTALRTLAHVRGRIENEAALCSGQTLSMAQLDEALFTIRDLVNYRAFLETGQGGGLLHLSLFSVSGQHERIIREVEHVLHTSPSTSGAFTSGGLMPGKINFSETNWFTTGVEKRTIVRL